MNEYYNLTTTQMGMWKTEQFYRGTAIANIGGTFILKEDSDIELWEKAINKFIENNESIRLRINLQDGIPFQYISEYEYKTIETINFASSAREEMDKWLSDKMRIPFDLYHSDLFEFLIIKTFDEKYGLYFKCHHLICTKQKKVHFYCLELAQRKYGNIVQNIIYLQQ